MPTKEAGEENATRTRTLLFIGLGTLALVLGFVVFALASRPPQMGADEEVFSTVDALFTAVTARDPRLVDDCERRLQAQRESGQLPKPAADSLFKIIRQTRAGEWESAAEKLYDFMKAQRREGPASPSAKPHTKGKGK